MALHPHPALVAAFEHEWGNSQRIFPALLEYNMAYIVAAEGSGSMPKPAADSLITTLRALDDEGFEAIDYRPERDGLQPNLEVEIQRRIGSDAGGWLSIGRARQECELVARQIVERDATLDVLSLSRALAGAMLDLARRDAYAVMPFHTWAQHAEPVTFGYYLTATTRTLLDDHVRMQQAFSQLNRSRAGIGQIVPPPLSVDRELLARLLGFESALPNSLHAYGSLDLELGLLSALTIFTANLARFADTLFVWASTDFGFLRFGDAFSGTSYAMPHKRNPYALRLVRPGASRVAGAFTEATQLFSGSLQIVGNGIIHIPNRTIGALDIVRDLCQVLVEALPTIEISRQRMRDSLRSSMCDAPQLLFHLMQHHGIPYRQSHEICGSIVSLALSRGCGLTELPSCVIGDIVSGIVGKTVELNQEVLRSTLDHDAIVASRVTGGPAPASVLREVDEMSETLAGFDAWLEAAAERRLTGRECLETRIQSTG